jgi:hypothetical protein
LPVVVPVTIYGIFNSAVARVAASAIEEAIVGAKFSNRRSRSMACG